MKSLVTGGAGFIGSHLCEALLRNGNEVIALDDLSTGSLDNLAQSFHYKSFEFIKGSILDPDQLRNTMRGCDEVYHLASVVGVSLILSHPSHGILVNTIGTENVFDCAQSEGCKVLFTSSSEVYGKDSTSQLSETSSRTYGPPDKLRWSYASSKSMSEFSAIARHQEFGLRVVITRLFNTVGPRQSGAYGMVLPRFISQSLQNKPVTVFGTGEQSRCFTWVGDVIEALIALQRDESSIGEIYNIGSDCEISIIALAAHWIFILNIPYSCLLIVTCPIAFTPLFYCKPARLMLPMVVPTTKNKMLFVPNYLRPYLKSIFNKSFSNL